LLHKQLICLSLCNQCSLEFRIWNNLSKSLLAESAQLVWG